MDNDDNDLALTFRFLALFFLGTLVFAAGLIGGAIVLIRWLVFR